MGYLPSNKPPSSVPISKRNPREMSPEERAVAEGWAAISKEFARRSVRDSFILYVNTLEQLKSDPRNGAATAGLQLAIDLANQTGKPSA